jgi:hypothetical protein
LSEVYWVFGADLVGSRRHPQIEIGDPVTDELVFAVVPRASPLRAPIEQAAGVEPIYAAACGMVTEGGIGNLCQQVRARLLGHAVADGFGWHVGFPK